MKLNNIQKEAIEALFPEDEQVKVTKIIETECGNNLPLCEKSTSDELDRIRLGVIKCSKGNLSSLEQYIILAKTDWRDLLMVSGFGNDIEEHNNWVKRGYRDETL